MPIFRRPCSPTLSALALLIGVTAFQQLRELPSPWWAAVAVMIALASWRYRRLPLLAIASLGFLWAWANGAWLLSSQLPTVYEGKDLQAEGVIAGLPEVDERRAHFEFVVTRLSQDGKALSNPGRILLNWYYPGRVLHPGERWRFIVKLKRPHGLSNPGGFDYEAWLFRRGLRATGYVRDDPGNRRLAVAGSSIDGLRQHLASEISTALEGSPYVGLVQALAIGLRSGINDDQWAVLTATGTNHLMAISGLHVGMVAGLTFFLWRWVWSRFSYLSLRYPAPKAGAVAAIGAALLYAAMAGFSIPTQRALIMLAVIMVGVMIGRRPRGLHVLGIALIMVLAWDPLAVLEPGFWLSFTAVAVIFYGMGERVGARGVWWKWGRVQILVAVGLVPLLLILFQRLSLVAPLANLFAVPWVTLVVVPLALLGTLLILPWPGLGILLLKGAAGALGWSWPVLAGLGHSEWAQWVQPAPPWWCYGPALLGVAWGLAPAGIPGRWLSVVLLAPMVLVQPPRPVLGEAWFTLLDVGQGLSAVVETAGHTLVFDSGPGGAGRLDAGRAVIVPFLRYYGLKRVDTLIVSHGDMDHRGGTPSLLAQSEVGRLLTSAPNKLSWPAGTLENCMAGQHWEWDGVDFELLYPFPAQDYRGNDASCVLKVSTATHSVLLPGDIERRSEQRLVASLGKNLAADILVAPHHGSTTSSTAEFLRAVQPHYALFPVGYRNRYGFPRKSVVNRYRAQGAILFDTAQAGAIYFRIGADDPLTPPVRYRQQARHYWNRP